MLKKFRNGISGADIEVVTLGDKDIIRKSSEKNIFKLIEQYKWLTAHQNLKVFPEVYGSNYSGESFSYDMRYYEDHITLNELILNIEPSNYSTISSKLIDVLKKRFYENIKTIGLTTKLEVNHYLQVKMIAKVQDAIHLSDFVKNNVGNELEVNSLKYKSLNKYLELIKNDSLFLNSLVEKTKVDVHGDLTAENILVNNNEFIFIDPNQDNILSTIALDLGKLYQSFYMMYELLDDAVVENISEKSYVFSLENESKVKFEKFFEILKNDIEREFKISHKELVFHSIVHFTRLLPYRAMSTSSDIRKYYFQLLILCEEFIANE